MSSSNRQVLIHEVHRVLKEHFTPLRPPANRTVLEHLLYACCLENAPFEAADEAFAKLQQSYFDWNEVRVTTITELAETLRCLPGPAAAATRLKRSLQSVFETHYAFDLEYLKKHKLGNAVKELEAIDGTTPFVVSYVIQQALSGHAIPCCQGVYAVFQNLGIMTQAEAAKRRVPALERAIPKAQGIEFASLLHQLGTEYSIHPDSARLQPILARLSEGLQKLVSKRSKAAASPEDRGDKKGDREKKEPGPAGKKPSPERQVAEQPPADAGPAAEPGMAEESTAAAAPEAPASEEPRLGEPESSEPGSQNTPPPESPKTMPAAETPLVEQPEDTPATGDASGQPPKTSAARKRTTSPTRQEERSEKQETGGDVSQPISHDPPEDDPGDPPERKKSTTKQLFRKKPR